MHVPVPSKMDLYVAGFPCKELMGAGSLLVAVVHMCSCRVLYNYKLNQIDLHIFLRIERSVGIRPWISNGCVEFIYWKGKIGGNDLPEQEGLHGH